MNIYKAKIEYEDGDYKEVDIIVTFRGTGAQSGDAEGHEIYEDGSLGDEWYGRLRELGEPTASGKVKTVRTVVYD